MMMLNSGTVSPRASSCSTGNLPTGHSARNASRCSASPRSTSFGVNGVPFSYKAISTLWQNEESGWKCSVSDMTHPCFVRTTCVALGEETCSMR